MTDRGLRLQLDDQIAELDPVGGRVTRYAVAACEVLAGLEDPTLFAYRGALLAPWPNRVTEGRWTWEGEQHQLPLDDPTGTDAALHGLVVHAPFDSGSRRPSSVELVHRLAPRAGYPFRLQLRVSYALGPQGLTCGLTAVNVDDRQAPVGLGVHPYLAAPGHIDDLVLTLPAATELVTDAQWREVGRRKVAAAVDFRTPRRVGELELDTCFTDLQRVADGRVEVVVNRPDDSEVVLWGGPTCRWLTVYTGHTLAPADRRRSIAVEPMTCPPNALATGEIDVLEPGERLQLDWGFTVRDRVVDRQVAGEPSRVAQV